MRRETHFPAAGWDYVVHVAANLARCVATVHGGGVVIGDLNDRNFGVDHAGIVRLWDADSVQLVHNGVTHLCPVGDPMHTPPELHGAELSSVIRTTDQDNFGLAVVVFSLLMQGQHPFLGVKPGVAIDLQEALDRAIFVYGEEGSLLGWEPPIGSPWLSHLPGEIGAMFERAFRAHRTGEPRPTATEWITALEAMLASLAPCGRGHWAVDGLKCPWCHAAAETRHQVFEPDRELFDQVALAEGRLGPIPASLLRTVGEVEQALLELAIAVPVLGDVPAHSSGTPSEWVRWEIAKSMAPVHEAERRRRRWLWLFRIPTGALLLLLALFSGSIFLGILAMVAGIPPWGKKRATAARQAAQFHFGHLQRRVSTWANDVRSAHVSLIAHDHAAVFNNERQRALDSLRAADAAITEREQRSLEHAAKIAGAKRDKAIATLGRPPEVSTGSAGARGVSNADLYRAELESRRKQEFQQLRTDNRGLVEAAIRTARLERTSRIWAVRAELEQRLAAGKGGDGKPFTWGKRQQLEERLKRLDAHSDGTTEDAAFDERAARRALAPMMAPEAELMRDFRPELSGDMDPESDPAGIGREKALDAIEADHRRDLAEREDMARQGIRDARLALVKQHAAIVARLTREAEEHTLRMGNELDEHARRLAQMPQANADIEALGRALADLLAP
jgi:hypothetical protein